MGPQDFNTYTSPVPPENGPALVKPAPEPTVQESAVALWVHRISLIVYVMFCIEIGLLLAVLPWTRVWTDNSIVVAYPWLRQFLQQNFVRGVVTGLGLLDIWLGIWEAVHYREQKTAPVPH